MRSFPLRGQIYYVECRETKGSEQKKDRPAVITSNNMANKYAPIVSVAFITGFRPERRFTKTHFVIDRYREVGLKKRSVVMLEHINEVDKSRLRDYKGQLNDYEMDHIDKMILISQGLSGKYKKRHKKSVRRKKL